MVDQNFLLGCASLLGGCFLNNVVLEVLVLFVTSFMAKLTLHRRDKGGGPLLTFCQFIFIALVLLPDQIEVKYHHKRRTSAWYHPLSPLPMFKLLIFSVRYEFPCLDPRKVRFGLKERTTPIGYAPFVHPTLHQCHFCLFTEELKCNARQC
jgi:hypothetical protein